MPFVAIADTAKVELLSFDASVNTNVVNVIHAKTDGAPTLPDLAAIATAFATFQTSFTANLAGSDVSSVSVTVTDLNTPTGPQYVLPNPGSASSGTPAASGLCALVKLTTGIRGRSFRGRIYMGPLGAGEIVGDQISSTCRTDLLNYLNTLRTNLQALTVPSDIVVASRKLAQSNAISTMGVELLAAYQRRRGAR